MLATDTLSVDGAGLKVPCHKILRTDEFCIGGSGPLHLIMTYYKRVRKMSLAEVLDLGYPDYTEDNCPAMIITSRNTPHKAWEICGSHWLEIRMPFYAVGSGRDFAIGAMHCGKTPAEAVEIASKYDLKTGMEIDVVYTE